MSKAAKKQNNEPTFKGVIERFNSMANLYASSLPMDSVYAAFGRAGRYWANQPNVQNARVKAISSLPADFTKEEIGEMLRTPYESEKGLRQTSEILRWTAYPFFKITKTYQDIPAYKYYFRPLYIDEEDKVNDGFKREACLVDKLNKTLSPDRAAHKIAGQTAAQGKVFYTYRIKADKTHNQIDYAFLQQLPEDYCEIIGFNNISGYTVSFNLMYFLKPGTDYTQFGDLFTPYLSDFNKIFEETSDTHKKYVFSSVQQVDCKGRILNINPAKVNQNAEGSPRVFMQDGRWYYYVSLPIDKVWTFEIDDSNVAAISPFSGLLLTYAQQSDYEAAQLSLVLNPLIMLLTGEIPFFNDDGTEKHDTYKLSEGARLMYETMFYETLAQNNTSGVGIFSAPFENIKSHTFPESANANDVSQSFSEYAAGKSGLAGLIPVSTKDIKASQVEASERIESAFMQCVLKQFERMMASIYRSLNLKNEFDFKFVGNIFFEKELRDAAEKAVARGDLSAYFILAALDGQSWIDKLSMSIVIKKSKLLDYLEVPPNANTQSTKENGRPKSDGITSEAKEKAIDSGISEKE